MSTRTTKWLCGSFTSEDADTNKAFTAAKMTLQESFVQQGVAEFEIAYDATLPSPQPGSGKFKHIVHDVK